VSAHAQEEMAARKGQDTTGLDKNDAPPLQPHLDNEWEFLHIARVVATKLVRRIAQRREY
jgi:hypothetical protein